MVKDFFFHIHYCNEKRLQEPREFSKIKRSLPHHELIYICSGTGTIKINNRKYSLKKGMLLYICPGEPHSIEIDTKFPSHFLTVHFSYTNVNFNDGKWKIEKETPRLVRYSTLELNDPYQVEELFQKLVDCWIQKLPSYEFTAKIMLQQLLLLTSNSLNTTSRNFATSLKVEKIIQYMHGNVSGKITVPELSALVSMTPAYMSRTFKDATGYTIIEYFNKLKIDKSKELLIEGNRKVKEVAQELGFADEFYFSRMFKRLEGITPSEFCSRIVHVF